MAHDAAFWRKMLGISQVWAAKCDATRFLLFAVEDDEQTISLHKKTKAMKMVGRFQFDVRTFYEIYADVTGPEVFTQFTAQARVAGGRLPLEFREQTPMYPMQGPLDFWLGLMCHVRWAAKVRARRQRRVEALDQLIVSANPFQDAAHTIERCRLDTDDPAFPKTLDAQKPELIRAVKEGGQPDDWLVIDVSESWGPVSGSRRTDLADDIWDDLWRCSITLHRTASSEWFLVTEPSWNGGDKLGSWRRAAEREGLVKVPIATFRQLTDGEAAEWLLANCFRVPPDIGPLVHGRILGSAAGNPSKSQPEPSLPSWFGPLPGYATELGFALHTKDDLKDASYRKHFQEMQKEPLFRIVGSRQYEVWFANEARSKVAEKRLERFRDGKKRNQTQPNATAVGNSGRMEA